MYKSVIWMCVLLMAATAAEGDTIEMKVNGLVCAFCARGIEKTFRKNPATADVVVSLKDKLVAVQTRDGADISDQDLRDTLKDAGYDVKSIERTQTPVADIRQRLRESGR